MGSVKDFRTQNQETFSLDEETAILKQCIQNLLLKYGLSKSTCSLTVGKPFLHLLEISIHNPEGSIQISFPLDIVFINGKIKGEIKNAIIEEIEEEILKNKKRSSAKNGVMKGGD